MMIRAMLINSCSALGDPTRFAIVESLLDEGEKSAGEICAGVTVSAPAVSRHLKILCDAGLLQRRVDRQRRLYTADPAGLGEINDWFESHVQFWTASVDRLQAVVEQGDN